MENIRLKLRQEEAVEKGFEHSGNAIIGYSGDKTDIIIPSIIEGVNITIIRNNAFYDKQLTSIMIPDSTEAIGMYAFRIIS